VGGKKDRPTFPKYLWGFLLPSPNAQFHWAIGTTLVSPTNTPVPLKQNDGKGPGIQGSRERTKGALRGWDRWEIAERNCVWRGKTGQRIRWVISVKRSWNKQLGRGGEIRRRRPNPTYDLEKITEK